MSQVVTNLSSLQGTKTIEFSLDASVSSPIIFLSSESSSIGAQILKVEVTELFNTWKTCIFDIKPFADTWYEGTLAPIINSSATPVIWVRWGFKSGANDTYMRPWEKHLIKRPKFIPDPAGQVGNRVLLETVDQLYVLNRISKTVCRKGNLTAIMNQILAENNINTSSAVVENNNNTTTSWIQSNQTDYVFLRDRLAHFFVGSQGAGDYRLYCRDNQIHFHTLNYTPPFGYVGNYYQYSNMSKLELSDDFYTLMLDGGSVTQAVAVDPIAGTATNISQDSSASPITASGERPVLPGAVKIINIHIGPNQLTDIVGRVQECYDERRSNYYSVKFALEANPLIQLGDVITIQFSRNTQFSGNYVVTAIKTSHGNNESTCIVEARRGQFNSTSVGVSSSVVYTPGDAISVPPGAAGTPIIPVTNTATNIPVNNPNSALTNF